MVSVGNDGCSAVTCLDDGQMVSTTVNPEAAWTATSKKHNPSLTVAVCDKAGVAFTGSVFQTSGKFWDLRSGKCLCKVASLGDYDTCNDKLSYIWSTSFSPSGMLAYTNCANFNVLKIIHPLVPGK